jgi:microcystin-dependent protein
MSITKNLLIGTGMAVTGLTTTNDIQPKTSDIFDLGTSTNRWKTVRAKTVIADEIQGVLNGNISGDSNRALSLKNVTTFQLAGDVVSAPVAFDGQVGSYNKIFNTELTSDIISNKLTPFGNKSIKTDSVLFYRNVASVTVPVGLYQLPRDEFVGDLGVPLGTIFPYAGSTAPYGYLLCDGSEVEIAKFKDLFNLISTTYNGATALRGAGTFRLPDMRGRFALGKDNMDNVDDLRIPDGSGSYIDAGGGTAGRVPDNKAQILGESAGQSSTTIGLGNLPDHEHSLQNAGVQYAALRVDTAINPPAKTGFGPTAPGQAQYLETSGPVKKPSAGFTLGDALGIMNPYLTLNYIIRSGPPLF